MATDPNRDVIFERIDALVVGRDSESGRTARRVRDALDHDVASALQSTLTGELAGDLCIRRLDIQIPSRGRRPGSSVSEQISGALSAEVQRLARIENHPDVVHYPTRSSAVVEAVCDLCQGRIERRWAWQQLGLLSRNTDCADRGAAIIEVLAAAPEHALTAVLAALSRRKLDVLDRSLGENGWTEVARLVVDRFHAVLEPIGAPQIQSANRATASTGQCSRIRGRSGALRSVERSPLRLTRSAATALAVIAVAEAEPDALRRADASQVIDALVRELRSPTQPTIPTGAGLGDAAPCGDAFGRSDAVPHRTDPTSSAQVGDHTADNTSDETSEETNDGFETDWAGLLFLLNLCAALDLERVVRAEPSLDDRSIGWVLHNVAGQLCDAPGDDSARRTFAGLLPHEPAPESPDDERTPERTEAVHSVAAKIRSALGDLDTSVAGLTLHSICHRRGTVRATRGWVDVDLPLSNVDIDVRRIGLDADPGWLPFLGLVVRFVYV